MAGGTGAWARPLSHVEQCLLASQPQEDRLARCLIADRRNFVDGEMRAGRSPLEVMAYAMNDPSDGVFAFAHALSRSRELDLNTALSRVLLCHMRMLSTSPTPRTYEDAVRVCASRLPLAGEAGRVLSLSSRSIEEYRCALRKGVPDFDDGVVDVYDGHADPNAVVR
jgi:hypothetical protein